MVSRRLFSALPELPHPSCFVFLFSKAQPIIGTTFDEQRTVPSLTRVRWLPKKTITTRAMLPRRLSRLPRISSTTASQPAWSKRRTAGRVQLERLVAATAMLQVTFREAINQLWFEMCSRCRPAPRWRLRRRQNRRCVRTHASTGCTTPTNIRRSQGTGDVKTELSSPFCNHKPAPFYRHPRGPCLSDLAAEFLEGLSARRSTSSLASRPASVRSF